MSRRCLLAALAVLAVGVAGCSGSSAAPTAPVGTPADPGAPLPVVTVVPGEAAPVALGRYSDARFAPPPGIDVDVAADGTASVRVGDGFRGLALVPFESGGAPYALAVQNPTGGGALALERVGLRAADPSVLDLRLSQRGPDGAAVPPTVDEDTGIVLLVDDAIGSETAIDYDPGAGVVGVDLDVAGPGAHRLRVAARAEGLVSGWVTIDVRDRRLAR